MEKLVERAGKAEVEIEKLYAEFERLQKLQPEEGDTPEELVRFVAYSDFGCLNQSISFARELSCIITLLIGGTRHCLIYSAEFSIG